MQNFKELKKSLEANDWTITIFNFDYPGNKRINHYNVRTKLYLDTERKPKYALLDLKFFKNHQHDEKNTYEVPVNSFSLVDDYVPIAEFFEIPGNGTGKNPFKNLYNALGSATPTTVDNKNITENQKRLLINSLSTSDSQDPDRLYIYAVRRNSINEKTGQNMRRSAFNSDKTKLLYPDIYENFKDDKGISFLYSTDRLKEKEFAELLENYQENN